MNNLSIQEKIWIPSLMCEESIYRHLPLCDHALFFPFVTALPPLHDVDHGWFSITPPLMCADHVLGGRLPSF